VDPGATGQPQDIRGESKEDPEPHDEDTPQDAGRPAQPQAHVSPSIRHEAAPVVSNDEHLI
jgi:hypothetical protein